MPPKSSAQTGVCIVRVTSPAKGIVLIEVSTVPDVEHALHVRRRPFTERQTGEALHVVSDFVTSCISRARRDGTESDAP